MNFFVHRIAAISVFASVTAWARAATLAGCALALTVAAAPADLDLTFNTTGTVVGAEAGSGGNDRGFAVALQPDGKIVVAGSCGAVLTATPYDEFCVFRYNSNGSLDVSFNGIGKAQTPLFAGDHDLGRAMALQTDGRIVVAGLCRALSVATLCVARFNSNGTLDNTFNGSGMTAAVVSDAGSASFASGVVVQASGHIVASGTCALDATRDVFCARRFSSAGVEDAAFTASFGTGLAGAPAAGQRFHANALILNQAGQIMMAGRCQRVTGSALQPQFCAARFDGITGMLDATFGSDNGYAFTTIAGSEDAAHAIVLRAAAETSAGFYLAGRCRVGAVTQMCLASYKGSGFSEIETAYQALGNTDAGAFALTVTGPHIVLGGSCRSQISGDEAFCLLRLGNAALRDTGFGNNGEVRTAFPGPFDEAGDTVRALVIQPDGKIVAAGYCGDGTRAGPRFCIARYQGAALAAVAAPQSVPSLSAALLTLLALAMIGVLLRMPCALHLRRQIS